jgi:WS/DGAT/MGAT family acyltransferase
MAKYAYERMRALDHSLLLLEVPNAHMHVASTLVFESYNLKNEHGGIDVDRIKALVDSHLHLIPRYRQRLRTIGRDKRPVWVDDEHFHLDYHIRHTSLPRPGTDEQLKRKSARLMERNLDRSRPLWELWVVEGLQGDRFALIPKVHHCMIDGIAGVELMMTLLNTSPAPLEVRDAGPFIPRRAPSRLEYMRDRLRRRATLPIEAVRDFRQVARRARSATDEALHRVRTVTDTVRSLFQLPSETPLNQPIGPHRRFDWLTMDLARVKAVRGSLGGTVNDVILTIVTGAVRGFLQRRHVHPETVEFRIMAPVSVRTQEEQKAPGNRISVWIVDLPVDVQHPLEQLDRIRRQTTELKESKQALGAEILTQMAEWASTTLLSLGARAATRVLPFNMVVTNVPGPQFPLYLLEARMLECIPHVPLFENLGLGVALMSYDGNLFWGFNADYDLLPDLWAFARGIEDTFEALLTEAGVPREATQDHPIAAV